MPRRRRKKSKSSLYHVVLRGVSKQDIFFEQKDYLNFLKIIESVKNNKDFALYAYCLMPNHVHILIQDSESCSVSSVIQSIATSYATSFNMRYSRHGHLFQNRFMSKPIEDSEYFWSVLRYIHLNPMKAGLEKKIGTYQYSSYRNYFTNPYVDANLLKEVIGEEEFINLHKKVYPEFSDYEMEMCNIRLTEIEAKEIIMKIAQIHVIYDFSEFAKEQQIVLIKEILKYHVSSAQIARITGIPYTRILFLAGKREKKI